MVEGWKIERVYPIHKGGDEEEGKNYSRGVAFGDFWIVGINYMR